MKAPEPHPDVHHRAAQRILNASPPPPGFTRLPLHPTPAGTDPLTGTAWAFPFHCRWISLAEFEREFPRRIASGPETSEGALHGQVD